MTAVETEGTTTLQKGFVGQNVPRREDKRLVQGEGLFFDDVKRHGMGYVHFVRSPYAHARIASIDVTAALELPGVYGTLTGDEVAILTDPFFQIAAEPGGSVKDYALAVGKVRYVGEPVVAVVAETRELARDASELVMVDYDPLDVVVDARKALEDGAPVLHEEAGGNMSYTGVWEWGDVDKAFAEADHVVSISELHFDRFNSTPLELDGALVEYNRGTGQWTITTNNQFPGFAVIMMAPGHAGRNRQAAHGHAGHRRRLRQQDHVASTARRALPARAEAQPARAVDRVAHRLPPVDVARQRALVPRHRGRRHGRRDDDGVPHEGDRRRRRISPLRAARRRDLVAGRRRDVRVAQHSRRVHAGDDEQGARLAEPGYSRMQHLWFTERLIDIVAHELGFDRVELRKKNYVQPGQMPYETPNGCVYDSGDYPRALDMVLDLIGYDTIEERREEAASRGKLLGFGIGSTLDSGTNNFGQSQLLNPDLQFSGNNEVATVKLDIFGEVVVTLGTTPAGPEPRDDGGAGRRRHPGLRRRHRARPGRATTATGTRMPASPARMRASSP